VGETRRSRSTGTRRATSARGRGREGERSKAAEDAPTSPEVPSVCSVAFCPICSAVSVVNRASPEVVQHLLVAGQQFLLALQALVDARAADFRDGGPDDDGREPPMQRVDIG
jgi:hypothetical protein